MKMPPRSPRRILDAWVIAMGIAGLVTATASSIGCKQTACIQWAEAEGMCPNRKEARTFFGSCTDISSINDDGAYSGNLCCYDVTKGNDIGECTDESTGFAVVAVGSGPFAGAVGSGPISSVASGLPACDRSGLCGGTATGCLGCALAGQCADWLQKCTSQTECTELLKCLSGCPPDAGPPDAGMSDAGMSDAGTCEDGCSAMFPKGAVLYTSMIKCAVCSQCPQDCAGMAASMCSGSGGAGGADGGKG